MKSKSKRATIAAIGVAVILAAVIAAVLVGNRSTSTAQTQSANPMILLSTTLGDITLELYPNDAPASAQNFIEYVEAGHFDGLIFHRVIAGFMIQGGGFTADMQQRSGRAPIQNEADNGLKNLTGTLAMARTSDPNSATSQFFINLADNAFLDHTAKTAQGWGYAVLGKVTAGMEVVEKIGAVPTGKAGPYSDVPSEAVVINRASVLPQ